MNRYELTYIIDATLEETARKELIAKFSSLIAANGGEVEKVDETWGKRRLAYPIDHKTEGYYVLVTYTAPVEVPAEVERNMRINDRLPLWRPPPPSRKLPSWRLPPSRKLPPLRLRSKTGSTFADR